MKCRHERTWKRAWDGNIWVASSCGVCGHDAIVCIDCGAWLSLGHSDEAPVAVEIEAARIAADRASSFGPDRFDYCPENKSDDLCGLCQAFYLAHFINERSNEHE